VTNDGYIIQPELAAFEKVFNEIGQAKKKNKKQKA